MNQPNYAESEANAATDRERGTGVVCFQSLPVAIRAKIEKTDSCWLWRGTIKPGGYGMLRYGGRPHNAHRWVYEQLVGPIPDGLHIDHLCRTRNCVNPEHLEPVTQAENNRRASGATRCKLGHERTDENTYVDPKRGTRCCLPCKRANTAKWTAGRAARRVEHGHRRDTVEAGPR